MSENSSMRPVSAQPHRRWLLAALLALPLGAHAPRAAADGRPLTVFAAASLTDALTALVSADAEAPRLVFAASSTLARQIEAGAPADLFISANEPWMDRLDAAGLLAPGARRDIASNRLVIVAAGDAAQPAGEPGDPAAVLSGRAGRIALGDPDHVPAGIYARTALESLGIWAETAPRLARADNTRAALALVARGEAPIGIVYASDARIVPEVKILAEIPHRLHPPIRYPAAVVAGRGSPAATAFLARLTGPEGQAALTGHGFGVP